MNEWNVECRNQKKPDWKYTDYKRFRTDCKHTRERLLGTYGKKGREVSDGQPKR